MDDRQAATAGHYEEGLVGFRDAWGPALGAITAPLFDRFLPAEARSVLDLGCGTGETSRLLRIRWPALGPGLIGADLVPVMLAEARRRHPTDALVQLDATRLPFRDGAFDLVVSAFLWHHIREQHRGFSEVFRVLAPGGRFVFLGWGDGESRGAAFDLWDQWLAEAGAPAEDPDPPPVWNDSLIAADALGARLGELGFVVHAAVDEPVDYRWNAASFLACRTGVGGYMRRYRTLGPAARARFDRRARAELLRLEPAAFGWSPRLVLLVAGRPGPATSAADCASDYRTVCPNCGAPMYDRGCKTRCPRCHFFTDCSDPW